MEIGKLHKLAIIEEIKVEIQVAQLVGGKIQPVFAGPLIPFRKYRLLFGDPEVDEQPFILEHMTTLN